MTSNFGFLSLLLQNGPRDRGEMNGEPGKGRIYAQRTYRDCRSYCRAGWRRAVAFVPPPTFVLARVLGLKGRRTLNEESFYANTHAHTAKRRRKGGCDFLSHVSRLLLILSLFPSLVSFVHKREKVSFFLFPVLLL